MKKPYIKIGLFFLLPVALVVGCSHEDTSVPDPERVAVQISGVLSQKSATTKGVPWDGRVDPINPVNHLGLPPVQLDVGIVTVNYETEDPSNPDGGQPDIEAWSTTTADWTRGYFGSISVGDVVGGVILTDNTPPTNGEISYTNEDGTLIQKTFYDDYGEHYFLRVVYPFHHGTNGEYAAELVQTPGRGAGVVFSGLDGSQDILCSNLGWGNIYQPLIETEAGAGNLVLSHMLTMFRVFVKAGDDTAITQYGNVTEDENGNPGLRLTDQPASVRFDMIDLEANPGSDLTHYYASEFPDNPVVLDNTSGTYIGYMMALPAQKFRVEVFTAERAWIHGEFSFATDSNPYRISEAGKIYDITLNLVEAYEIQIKVSTPKEWWMNSTFD